MGLIKPFTNAVGTGGPEVRLLVCGVCKTVEVLDDYRGPQERAEEYDVVLNLALEKHQEGVERRPHVGQMFRVQQADWDDPAKREQIHKQVVAQFDPNAETGLGSEAYALRDNFREDAFKCWQEHRRIPACPDYKSEAKQLVPQTQVERREAGLPKFERGNPATQRYLCEYCPVHSLVTQAKRDKAGMYDQ